MAGEGEGGGAGGQEGGGTPPAGSAGASGQEGSDDKGLESLEPAKLAGMIRDLRKEAKTNRERAEAAEGKTQTLSERLTKLEESSKTEEQKAKDRQAALEADAAKAASLAPYESFVKGMLDTKMKGIEAMRAADKKHYTDLLATIPETDIIARYRAITVLEAARGDATAPKPGDEGNPGEPGTGVNDKTLAQKVGWSSSGMAEARMAGAIPATK